MPKGSFPCFPEVSYRGGRLIFLKSQLLDGHLQPLQWKVDVQNSTFFQATSEKVQLAAGKSLVAFALISHLQTLPALPHALEANQSFSQALARWEGYLRTVLQRVRDPQMDWAAVKAVATLMGNWRAVPGLPPGVLPSYVGYEGGFWSWDTYRQLEWSILHLNWLKINCACWFRPRTAVAISLTRSTLCCKKSNRFFKNVSWS